MGVFIPFGYGQATMHFKWTGLTNVCAVTFGYQQRTSPGLPSNEASLWNTAFTDISSKLCNATKFSSQLQFLGFSVVEHRTGGLLSGDAPVSITGSGVQDMAPPQVALLVDRVTTFGGRTNRGRFYLPAAWTTEANVSSTGNISAADVISINALLNTTFNAITTAGFGHYLLHENPSAAPTLITAWNMQNTVATQRRRLRR